MFTIKILLLLAVHQVYLNCLLVSTRYVQLLSKLVPILYADNISFALGNLTFEEKNLVFYDMQCSMNNSFKTKSNSDRYVKMLKTNAVYVW